MMKPFKRLAGVFLSLMLIVAMSAPAVMAADEKPIPKIKLSVGNGQTTPSYKPGDSVEHFSINVTNEGTADAKNVVVTPILDSASDWPFEIKNMNNDQKLGDIPAGQEQGVTADWPDLKVRSDAETKSYKLLFRITYNDGTYEYQADKYVFAKIEAPAEEEPPKPETQPEPQPEPEETVDYGGEDMGGTVSNSEPTGSTTSNPTTPRVIVTGFNTDPGVVNAGNNFKLIIHLKNTSTRTAVSNMLFDLQAPSSGTEAAAEAPAFLPASGSSSIFLDSIPAGGASDISIDLNARADLVQKPYSIAMSMKYEDGNAAQYESASSLAIPVQQAARFEFSDIEAAPEAVAVGEEANITSSLYNTGRIKLYNVKVLFQGDGIEGKEVFVGNIEPGATGSIDGIVTGTKEMTTDQKCKMTVTYEDASGKASTTEKEFALEVTPEQAAADMTAMMPEVPQKSGFPLIPVIIAVIVILAAVIVFIVIKRKKKKMKSEEEEDLMNEVDRLTEDE